MSGSDPLDNEVSVAGELTATGVKARAKSRLISGLDRLGGNLTEWLNVRIEENTSLRRARINGEKQLLEAAVQYGVERLGRDAAFAERALEKHFQEALGKQANRDAVIDEAVADLRRQPPLEDQANSGAEQIDTLVLDRIADYAGQASTNALREKWGRVLAAEVRSPGSFSPKVLRLVDELEPETAKLFESICQFRIGSTVPIAASPKLSLSDMIALDGAGLVVEPGLGHSIQMRKATATDGTRLHVIHVGTRAISVPMENELARQAIGPGEEIVELVGDELQIPVYTLTPEGSAIASILPYSEVAAANHLAELIKAKVPEAKTYTFDPKTQLFEDD